MINTLKKLIELQAIDADIFVLRKEQNNIPGNLRIKKAEYDEAVKNYLLKKDGKQNIAIELDKLKLDIATEEEHRNNLQSKQAMVKKNNEYQALTKEIKDSADKEKRLNSSLSKKEEALKANSAAFSEQQKQAEKIKHELLQEADIAKKEISKIDLKINKYKLLRKEIEKDVKPEFLSLYSNLLKTRAPTVVVKANNNVCEGCHINLTAQVIVDIKKADKLVTCENCARILFLEAE